MALNYKINSCLAMLGLKLHRN